VDHDDGVVVPGLTGQRLQVGDGHVGHGPDPILLRQPVRLPVDGRGRTTGDELRTTGARHPVQKERQEASGFAAYWEDFWSNADVFYGHVLGFKGMERHAVVLCLNEDGSRERFRERLYVGLSRATDRLVVVGDPDVIERACGRDVREGLLH